MKKVLSLAFIAAVLLLGCSADGFFDGSVNATSPESSVEWSKVCKVTTGTTAICQPVEKKSTCDNAGGILVSRSECPDDGSSSCGGIPLPPGVPCPF